MSNLLTQQMKTRQAIDFKNGFASNTEKSFFIFLGKPDEWDSSDSTGTDSSGIPTTITDSAENTFAVVDDIIMARQVFDSDASLVVSRLNWATGTVYDIYDSSKDAFSVITKFYVLTDDFNVYKCISNNGGTQSTVKPTSTTTEEEITSDGYIWKFLYKIPESKYEFLTSSGGRFNEGFMPIEVLPEEVASVDSRILQRNVETTAVHGEIVEIIVTNEGDAYAEAIVQPPTDSTDTGTGTDDSTGLELDITQTDAPKGATQIKINVNASAKQVADIYNDDYIIHITSGTAKGTIRTIKDYLSSGICVVDTLSKAIPSGSHYEILPRIEVTGNGTGAVAIPVIDYNTKKITSIDVVIPGTDYTDASVTIRQKENSKRRDTSTARAILAPAGGHGAYIAWELGASNVMVKGQFDNTATTTGGRTLPTTRYHQTGLISNLLANNTTTNVTSPTVLGLDANPAIREITIDNEYKTQVIYFNECNYLGQDTDGTLGPLATGDFIVGDIVKQGPDGSTQQARGVVRSWELVADTAPGGFDSGCGCSELGPVGNAITIGKLTVEVLQSEFKDCTSSSYGIVREQYPKTFFSTDDTGYDADTDKVETYEDSAYPQQRTTVQTTGSYNDNSFTIGHYVYGDTSKVVGKIVDWTPLDAGNGGKLQIEEQTKPANIENPFDFGWIEPSFDSNGNVVNGEVIHYIDSVDVATGKLDVESDGGTTAGRILGVKTIQEFQPELLLSGTVQIGIKKNGTAFIPITEANTSFKLGERVYQMPIGVTDEGIDGSLVTASGKVAGYSIEVGSETDAIIELVDVQGVWNTDSTGQEYTLVTENELYNQSYTGVTIEVTSVAYSEFSKKYGYNLLYIQNVETIQRADNQTDTTKIIVEF